MSPKWLATLGILIAVLIGCVGRTGEARITGSKRERAIAERHCALSDAVVPDGRGPVGVAPPFRELSRRYPNEMLAEALRRTSTGHPAMPVFTFHPREIDALRPSPCGRLEAQDRLARITPGPSCLTLIHPSKSRTPFGGNVAVAQLPALPLIGVNATPSD